MGRMKELALTKCRIRGCEEDIVYTSLLLCRKHYRRYRIHGDPETVLRKRLWDGLCNVCSKGDGPFNSNANYQSTTCRRCLSRGVLAKRSSALPTQKEGARERARDYAIRAYRALRLKVTEHYGAICDCCSESRLVFLALDHKYGGGAEHRRALSRDGAGWSSPGQMYRWVVKNNFPDTFRVLCHNCNFALAHGDCPHALD